MVTSFLPTDFIGIAGILISFLTLSLAYLIYKKVGESHMRTKQIDHVCELIECLNSSKIEVCFSDFDEHGGFGSTGKELLNIFDIGNSIDFEGESFDIDFSNDPVYLQKDSNQIIDVKMFVDSPLTPKPIADKLLNFHNSRFQYIYSNEQVKGFQFIELISGKWNKDVISHQEKGQLIKGNAVALSSWLSLKEHSTNLKRIIGNWLVENGIKENNIREDFRD